MCWYTEFHNCEFHKYMKNKPHIFVNKSLQYRMRKSTENQPVARYSVVLQGSGMTGTLSIPACCCPSSASTYGHGLSPGGTASGAKRPVDFGGNCCCHLMWLLVRLYRHMRYVCICMLRCALHVHTAQVYPHQSYLSALSVLHPGLLPNKTEWLYNHKRHHTNQVRPQYLSQCGLRK